ncbi:uncharacterized protein LOC142353170 isoform X2 [Convolutriloba macropyga]
MPNNEELKPLINYDLNSSFIHEYCHHLLHIKKWVPENIHLTPVICYAPGDRYLARLITRKGNYEDGLQKKFFKDVFPKFPNAAFVDIGANIGVYTISAGVLGGKVFAVEPMPETLKSLSQSVAVNSLLDRVSVYPYGLMDKKSCVYPELFESGNNKGATRLIKDPNCTHNNGIKIATLDQFLPTLKRLNISQVIIKMDIEEAEPFAIIGGQNFLEQIEIPFFTMEFRHMANTLRSQKPENLSRKQAIYKMLEIMDVNFTQHQSAGNDKKYQTFTIGQKTYHGGRRISYEQQARKSITISSASS